MLFAEVSTPGTHIPWAGFLSRGLSFRVWRTNPHSAILKKTALNRFMRSYGPWSDVSLNMYTVQVWDLRAQNII